MVGCVCPVTGHTRVYVCVYTVGSMYMCCLEKNSVYVRMPMFICVCLCLYAYAYVYMRMMMFICVCLCLYAYDDVYRRVSVNICVFMILKDFVRDSHWKTDTNITVMSTMSLNKLKLSTGSCFVCIPELNRL